MGGMVEHIAGPTSLTCVDEGDILWPTFLLFFHGSAFDTKCSLFCNVRSIALSF